MLDELEKRLLMELQYRFPQDPTPIQEAARNAGIEPGRAIETLTSLKERGILKRIGFYVNYRSVGLRAALIAYAARSEGAVERLAEIYAGDRLATHVYLRDHPEYNVWVVTKRRSIGELLDHARRVSERVGAPFILLYSKRTYKLSVKFDLYEGVSRAGPYSMVAQSPPPPERYGLSPDVLRLYRSLEISESPYKRVASALGVSEREAARLAWELVSAGLLGDPGAALDGHKAGFRENAMVVMEPSRGQSEEDLCNAAAGSPYTTHVVLRGVIPEGAWRHTCYFMVHAVDKQRLKGLVESVTSRAAPESFMIIRSLADLKPGVVR